MNDIDVFDDDTIDEIDRKDKPAAPPATIKATVPAASGERLVNPLALFRQRNSSGGVLFRGDLIKCQHNSGNWLRMKGEDAILLGHDERFTVNPLELVDTWSKFVGGKLITRHIYRTVEFEFAPERAALGDLDENLWELERNGRKRKDPWSRALYLPMRASSDGEVCAFKATGQGAISEIAELCGMYAATDRGGKLPVIAPDSRNFESSHNNLIYVPVFKLVDWAFWDDTPAPPVPLRPMSAISLPAKPATPATAKLAAPAPVVARHNDMDDDIPF